MVFVHKLNNLISSQTIISNRLALDGCNGQQVGQRLGIILIEITTVEAQKFASNKYWKLNLPSAQSSLNIAFHAINIKRPISVDNTIAINVNDTEVQE